MFEELGRGAVEHGLTGTVVTAHLVHVAPLHERAQDAGTERMSEEQLAALVTRDSMIGVGKVSAR